MELTKRLGRTSRQIVVPLCRECATQLVKSSAAEERMQKLSRLLTVVTALLLMTSTLLLFPGTILGLRFIFAILLAAAGSIVLIRIFRMLIRNAALPEKKAVLGSARLETFSWRSATFTFTNDSFVERFTELNDLRRLET